jgi:TonB family protein
MRIARTLLLSLCGLTIFGARHSIAADAVTLDAAQAKQFVLYAPTPDYPIWARREYRTGDGVFLLNIDDQKGTVTSIKIEKTTGFRSLDVSCLKALIRWRFRPHTLTKVRVPVRFVMRTFNMG